MNTKRFLRSSKRSSGISWPRETDRNNQKNKEREEKEEKVIREEKERKLYDVSPDKRRRLYIENDLS